MPENSVNNKRIAKNTFVLYLRTIVVMCISLYTSRVVLKSLGVEDFGLYNVIGGFVAMFILLTGSLSNAITRYITFELGRNNTDKLKKIFSTSLFILIILSLIFIIIAESIGIFFVSYKMNIPDGRNLAANWVLQFSILTFVVNLLNVPYQASVIAHEKMTAFAYISILEAVLKLAVVINLEYATCDKLILYSFLLFAVSVIVRITNGFYCSAHFVECRFKFMKDTSLMKEMVSLAGWNFLGTGGVVLSNHGINILMNLFFGVSLNAARGIAVQVENAVTQFVQSFTSSMNPQITKLFATGNHKEMYKIVFSGTKFAFFLMFLLAMPLIVFAPKILSLWLGVVPEYAVVFVRLTLLQSLITILSVSLYTVALATGDIKKYQLWVGNLSLSQFLVVLIIYYMGFGVEAAYYVCISIQVLILIARLYVLHKQIGLDVLQYCMIVLYRVLLISIAVPIIIYNYLMLFGDSLLFIYNLFICEILIILPIYIIGLNSSEKKFLYETIEKKIYKLSND